MQPTSNDVSFNLFGFPTVIQPFFWLIAAVITAVSLGPIDNMPFWIAKMLLGMAGVLLAILVHELGHAFVFRHVFHTPCAIVLHSFGGMAIPMQPYARHYGFRGMISNGFLSFAGPLAGFMLAFVIIMLLQVIPDDDKPMSSLFTFFLQWTATISIIWGIFNLLPIYPMDGGHIAREMFVYFFQRRGIDYSLVISMLFASLLAILALRYHAFFIAVILAYFAYQNYQELTQGTFRR